MTQQRNSLFDAWVLDTRSSISDMALFDDLCNDILRPFWSLMDRMYTAQVHWSRYGDDNPIATLLRQEIDDLCGSVRDVIRRRRGHPELHKGLRTCLHAVDNYQFVDEPVLVEGMLDRSSGLVRSDFFSEQERLVKPFWVEQATEAAADREGVLKRERGRFAESIHRLTVDIDSHVEHMAGGDKIEWTTSAAAFEHVFSTLAAQGYLKLPTKGGKQGDANLSLFARQLLQLFLVPGNDGKPITADQLRTRVSPGSESKLAKSKRDKFQIPPANMLIIPPAEDLK